ncbi:MAG: SOS response-associated peptidase family protein [Pseudolabrys sp.]
MCGRFTQHYTWQELVALYRLTVPASNLQPRYNIAPTTTIDFRVAPDNAERSKSSSRLFAKRQRTSDAFDCGVHLGGVSLNGATSFVKC